MWCCGSEGQLRAGRQSRAAPPSVQGAASSQAELCGRTGEAWSRPVLADAGTKPHTSSLTRGVLSPSVTGTLLGFSCPWHMLALLRRLGKDKHRSVLDAVWKSLDSRHIAEQQGHWCGLQEQAVPAALKGKGEPSTSKTCRACLLYLQRTSKRVLHRVLGQAQSSRERGGHRKGAN